MYNAELYADANELQRRDAESALAERRHLMRCSGDHERVIDVGCGDGSVTATLLLPTLPPNVARVTGVDVSPTMIKHATAAYASDRLDFRLLDIQQILPPDYKHAYDHVFSFNCFHWVQDQSAAFRNVHALLRPGGDCFVTMIVKNPIYDVYGLLEKMPKWKPYMKNLSMYISPYHGSLCPVSDVEKLLRAIGFNDVDVTHEQRTYFFNRLEHLKSSTFAVNPFLSKIPPHLHDEYFDDYLGAIRTLGLIEEHNNNILIKAHYRSLIVYATK